MPVICLADCVLERLGERGYLLLEFIHGSRGALAARRELGVGDLAHHGAESILGVLEVLHAPGLFASVAVLFQYTVYTLEPTSNLELSQIGDHSCCSQLPVDIKQKFHFCMRHCTKMQLLVC